MPARSSLDVNIFTIESELPFAGHPYHRQHSLPRAQPPKVDYINTLVTKAGPIRIGPDQAGGGEGGYPACCAHPQADTAGLALGREPEP